MRRLAFLVPVILAGCHSAPPSESETTTGPRVPQGVNFREVRLDGLHRIWVYEPTDPGSGKRPCVLIAPAGSHLFDGMLLGDGDRDEQFPYAKAGYVVVAYDVSGPLKRETRPGIKDAAKQFLKADLGLTDARRALAWALKNPLVDPKRIVVAGHSSAGTLALMVAENEPSVAACLAYAPVVDVPNFLRPVTKQVLRSDVPGLIERIDQLTPTAKAADLRCPTFVFHAADDAQVPTEPLASFARSLPNTGFKEVPEGGHYTSMIEQGIPAGIAFLKDHGLAP